MSVRFFVGVLHASVAPEERLSLVCERLDSAAYLHVERFEPFGPMATINDVGHASLKLAVQSDATHVILVATDFVPCKGFVEIATKAIEADPERIVCFTAGEVSAMMDPGWYSSIDGMSPFFCIPIETAKDFLAFYDECVNDLGRTGTIDLNLVLYAQAVGVPIHRTVPSLLDKVAIPAEVDWTQPVQAFAGRETTNLHWRLIGCLHPKYRKVRLAYDIERARPIFGPKLQKKFQEAQRAAGKVPFACPESMVPHVQKVVQGEYDFPKLDVGEKPTILDLGANLGSFALWASKRWQGCKVLCYEPHPDNIKLLKNNVEAFELPAEVFAVAVTSRDKPVIFDGRNNCGEASLDQHEGTTDVSHPVEALHPSDLPPAQMLKIDTEGSEWDILRHYRHYDWVKAVVLEWHSREDKQRITEFLISHGFQVGKDEQWAPNRGVLGFYKAAP